ncbi:hypothetical protein [uncultured Christiangramia sp.]|uniref:hypothetical protein n=1 Tax=uncultured Christiangramia sp. TaxID=503836 RepID=UPI00262B1C76|nr:hypothetical protein [uncultured Christiangramia sp.]
MKNIFQDKTLAEYLLTEDKDLIDVVLQNVEPKKIITLNYKGKDYKLKPRVNDLFFLEWKWIMMIKKNLTESKLSAVKDILQGIYPINTEEQFYNCSVFDVFAAYAWVVEEIQNIYDAEKMKLYKKPSSKQLSAGIEDFDQLEDVPVIDGIANGDIRLWNEVLELPYGQVLRKMLLTKIQNEYNERLSKQK